MAGEQTPAGFRHFPEAVVRNPRLMFCSALGGFSHRGDRQGIDLPALHTAWKIKCKEDHFACSDIDRDNIASHNKSRL